MNRREPNAEERTIAWKALQLAIDVYLARIAEPGMPLQESQVYFVHASVLRAKLARLSSKPTP